MNKIFLSVLLLLPALFPVQGQSWRALQQQAQKRGELASARQIILLDSTAVSPDFVNVSPKNHLQIMGRYVDVVS